LIVSYIKYLLRAGNAHAIHSPFVYNLYTKVIRPAILPVVDFTKLEAIRQKLQSNSDTIEVLDLGAGSRINKSNRRKIRDIARNAEKPARFGRLFYRLTQYFQPETIIELGTSLGVTTAYFAQAAPQSRLITFEGCPETARVARKNFAELGLNSVVVEVGNIDETLPQVLAKLGRPVDLVFFDANHRYEPTIRYFEIAKRYASPRTLFVFDDIYWSDEMKAAWEHIKSHPDVTLTLDLFWIGLVFFRNEQPKENFVLRF
jgi:predicted O-methyltransferase YrrM